MNFDLRDEAAQRRSRSALKLLRYSKVFPLFRANRVTSKTSRGPRAFIIIIRVAIEPERIIPTRGRGFIEGRWLDVSVVNRSRVHDAPDVDFIADDEIVDRRSVEQERPGLCWN
jgi:hypothetical protein